MPIALWTAAVASSRRSTVAAGSRVGVQAYTSSKVGPVGSGLSCTAIVRVCPSTTRDSTLTSGPATNCSISSAPPYSSCAAPCSGSYSKPVHAPWRRNSKFSISSASSATLRTYMLPVPMMGLSTSG